MNDFGQRVTSILKTDVLLTLFLIVVLSLQAQAGCVPGPDRLCPTDEATDDASFLAFRNELMQIVQRRDWSALSGVITDDIRVSFGPGNGKQVFIEHWRPQNSDSPFWMEFETVLSLGGSFVMATDAKTFCAPYVYTKFPAGRDTFRHHAVLDEAAPLRIRPDAASDVIVYLDHALVRTEAGMPEIHSDDAGNEWIAASYDGHAGYVQVDDVRSPLDYRACFSMMDNGWKLRVFIAGD